MPASDTYGKPYPGPELSQGARRDQLAMRNSAPSATFGVPFMPISRLDRLFQLFNADRQQTPLSALSLDGAADPTRVMGTQGLQQNPELLLRLLQLSQAIGQETNQQPAGGDDTVSAFIAALLSQLGQQR